MANCAVSCLFAMNAINNIIKGLATNDIMAHVLIESTGVSRAFISLPGANNLGSMAFKLAALEPYTHIGNKLKREVENL